MTANPIPQGYRTITPYLAVKKAEETIDLLRRGFNAEVLKIHKAPNGQICNAEIRIGDSNVMLGEVRAGDKAWPSMLYMYVKDCDSVYHQAIKAGGKSV